MSFAFLRIAEPVVRRSKRDLDNARERDAFPHRFADDRLTLLSFLIYPRAKESRGMEKPQRPMPHAAVSCACV